jgi:hypothetical protein
MLELVQTGCYYTLKGDYTRVHLDAPVILPDLQVLPGGACDVDQAAAFQVVDFRALILSNVVQVLQANLIQQRSAQLDAAGNPPTLVMWRALRCTPRQLSCSSGASWHGRPSCRPLLCIKGSPSWTESGLPLY